MLSNDMCFGGIGLGGTWSMELQDVNLRTPKFGMCTNFGTRAHEDPLALVLHYVIVTANECILS
jgi:hypothetical protein